MTVEFVPPAICVLGCILASVGSCSIGKMAVSRLADASPSLVQWTPGNMTAGLEFSNESERGFRQVEVAPKVGWSPLVIAAGRSRCAYEMEIYFSEQRTHLVQESSQTQTIGWSIAKVKLLEVAGLNFEAHHVVPHISVGVERSAVREGDEMALSRALSWGIGGDVELGGGLGVSIEYREAQPRAQTRHSEETVGLEFSFGGGPVDGDGGRPDDD